MPSELDIAFPRLSRAQIDSLRRWGHVRPIAPGDVLFREGDCGFSFFVVLEGAVEIVEQSRGTPHQVVVHEPGQFTGDVDTLSGRAALVTGRATARGEVRCRGMRDACTSSRAAGILEGACRDTSWIASSKSAS